MKKMMLLFIPFVISACIPRTPTDQASVPRETVRQIETKAADTSEAEILNFKELDGYFLKNNVKLTDNVNFFTVSAQKDFDKILGIAKTMTNVITPVDFKNSMVVVVAMKPSQSLNNIKITKAYLMGSDVYVEYEILPAGIPDVGYFLSNMAAFAIQRPKQILNVSFVDTNKKMTILPFGRRIAGSPSSLEVLLKYYTGRYKGTIPAADGPGIAMMLTLSSDYTYRLEQSYLSNPARTFESTGKWAPSDDLSFFVLDYEKPKQEQTAFCFLDRSTIEKLDINREKIETSAELYRLKK